MVYHIYRHMKKLCHIDKIEISSIMIKKHLDEDKWWRHLAILEIMTMEEIYIKKRIYEKFNQYRILKNQLEYRFYLI